ncbi:MAG: four helix bundle protein [bacterium]
MVYKKAYSLSVDLFWMTREFPKEERYSLTDQLLRASRSIPSNTAEGWAKRHYENVFKQHLIDAIGSCEETKVWIDFAYDCKYITKEKHKTLIASYEEIGRMLTGLFEHWKTY